jgi:hypothetical protein
LRRCVAGPVGGDAKGAVWGGGGWIDVLEQLAAGDDAIIPEKASWGSRTHFHARGTMRVDAV